MAIKRQIKKLKRKKMGNKMSKGSFEKLRHIPGNLEGHTDVQDFAHIQERPEKALKFHFCKNVTICENIIH